MKRDKHSLPICPQCGDPFLQTTGKFDGWIFPVQYQCVKCGYIGYASVEIDPPNKKADS